MLIVVLASIISAIVGFGIGSALGFWKSLIVGAIVGFALFQSAYGIAIIELPIGMVVGGLFASRR